MTAQPNLCRLGLESVDNYIYLGGKYHYIKNRIKKENRCVVLSKNQEKTHKSSIYKSGGLNNKYKIYQLVPLFLTPELVTSITLFHLGLVVSRCIKNV